MGLLAEESRYIYHKWYLPVLPSVPHVVLAVHIHFTKRVHLHLDYTTGAHPLRIYRMLM